MKTIPSLVVLISVLILAGSIGQSWQASSSHPFLLQWGQSGINPGSFYSPQHIAVDSEGNVYVTDLGNRRVQKFDNAGTFLLMWGSSGTGGGQFNSPAGIAVFENFVFVVDSQLNKVQKFDTDGNFLLQWGSQGKETGQFLLPNGIAVNKNGIVHVVDTGNQRIQQFTLDGEFVKEFGGSGSTADKFVSPIDISLDLYGNIYVSDPGNNAIKKFDSYGNFLKKFGPNSGGMPISPQGLANDPNGDLYVADTDNNRIIKFDQEGTTITTFGSMGIKAGQYKFPKDVALDPFADLYVVDSNGHRIQKFDTPIVVDNLEQTQSNLPLEEKQAQETQPAKTPVQTDLPKPTITPVPGDLTKPTIVPQNNLLIEATGVLTPVSVGQAMAYDESGIKSLTNNVPPQFPLGITTVIWTAIDGAGNVGIATQIVTVTDTIPPTVTPLPDIAVEAVSPTGNVVELKPPTANDAVGIMSISNDAPMVFPMGETLVTWTVADVIGNKATTVQKVNVIDTTKPKIYAPEDIVVEASSIDKNEINLGEATVIDNGLIESITNDSPLYFGIGNTTVTWMTSDSFGNIATSQQLVSVIDTTLPELIPPPDVIFEATSTNENVIDVGSPAVNDVQEVTITNDAPIVFPMGETIVNWFASDKSDNSVQASQVIIVVDTTPPTVLAPENISVEATALQGNVVNLGEIHVDDISGISSISNDAPQAFPLGSTSVLWSVTDNAGNVATAEQIVTVVDTTSPVINPPKDIVVEATSIEGNFVDFGQPKVSDLVEVASITNDAPAKFPIGMTTITWTATDTSGNSASATQVINVVDSTPPTIIPPPDITAEASGPTGNSIQLGEAVVEDIVGISSVTNDALGTYPIGETLVTWTAIDSHGNSVTATQKVTVVDTTAPTIKTPDPVVFEATSADQNLIELQNAVADDIVGVVSISNNAPDSFPVGETIVTWTATDTSGNSATATQLVTVVDTTPPIIQKPDDIKLEATSTTNNQVVLQNPLATDLVSDASITNNAPDSFPVGETIVTWTATDTSGNSATATQLVTVVDTTSPVINPPKDIVVEATSIEGNFVDFGQPKVSDLVEVASITNDAPAKFPIGMTTITWTATDTSGNSASATQVINVVDTTPPSILVPADVVIEATTTSENVANLGKATANDLVGILSITNDAQGSFPYGETIVTWNATDTSGNSVTAQQKVTVIDTTPPVITPPKDIVLEATSPDANVVEIGSATATDIIGVVSVTNDASSNFPLGDTIVTWMATDQDGNSVSGTQKITVIDTTPPSLVIPDKIVAGATAQMTSLDIGNATSVDLTDPSPIIHNDSPTVFPLGETVVTWTTTDSFGNVATATQIVEIQACGKPISYYNMIEGTNEDDVIVGTSQPDLIFALNGDDIIRGEKGNDCIFGGDGDDIIFGNEGNDTIYGDDGNDIIKGQSGNDTLHGGVGSDIIDGGDDQDSCTVSETLEVDLKIKCES